MTSNVKLKESYEVESKHAAFYTGGNIHWFNKTIFCQNNSCINLLDIEDGKVYKSIGEENSEDSDYIQTFTTDGEQIVSSHKSGLLKLWNLNGEIIKMWKYIHKGPIACLELGNTTLASGGSDSIVRIWNLQYQACTLSLKGSQGVINVVKFINSELLASGDDGKINSYELEKGNLTTTYSAHFSKVVAITTTQDEKYFVSIGRDKVIIHWELKKSTPLKVIPAMEAIEALALLPSKFKLPNFSPESDGLYVATAGETGIITVWDVTKSKPVFKQTNSLVSKASEPGGLSITKLILNPKTESLAVITVDHNVIIHHLKSFAAIKQFIGFTDEILDCAFVGFNDSHLAVATNSNDIKLYDQTMNCQLLKGHTDLVLSLNTSKTDPNLMISSSKDNSIRFWKLSSNQMLCIGIGSTHTNSVGSACFINSNKFALSVSQDSCLKLWEIDSKVTELTNLVCLKTEIAHEKDINSVAVSPNDKLFATASQDKTIKLWSEDLKLAGVLRGHRRGVWSCSFSPVDQVIVSSSADCSIKLWSVADLSCLKTIEGHESSVLRVEFLSNGLQLISAGADGLLKLFSIKTSECIGTFDQHEGRVWGLAVSSDESKIVTGGSDSLLVKWQDVTEVKKMERLKEMEEMALQEQKLNNYLQSGELSKALKLALRLNRPMQTLRIVQGVMRKGGGLEEAVGDLRDDQKDSLMKCVLSWNMNGKHCQAAQAVLNVLLHEIQTGSWKASGLGNCVEGALPYTERHFKRLTQLLQDLYFVDYTINCMLPHAKSIL